MTTIACPRCAGDAWVQDVVLPASGPSGDLRLTRGSGLAPLRWTCAGCGYQAKADGVLSWRLDSSTVDRGGPIAAAGRAR